MYQAFVIGRDHEFAAERRYSSREAREDADRMHSTRDGVYRVVVLDERDQVVYDLPASEA